jgi:hypothetical protein
VTREIHAATTQIEIAHAQGDQQQLLPVSWPRR